MKTNEIKSGSIVRMRDGSTATVVDNRRGNTRMVAMPNPNGTMDRGSVYAHDIVAVQTFERWVPVWHTPEQQKLRQMVGVLFG
jgi:hypothetical protein